MSTAEKLTAAQVCRKAMDELDKLIAEASTRATSIRRIAADDHLDRMQGGIQFGPNAIEPLSRRPARQTAPRYAARRAGPCTLLEAGKYHETRHAQRGHERAALIARCQTQQPVKSSTKAYG